MPKFYLTTAIDYANSVPHTGHTFEKVLADAMARFQRLRGVDTWFQMGMDEHGAKVQQTAEARGIAPQAFVDAMAETYVRVWKAMDISYDAFVRTTDPRHMAGVQELFARWEAKGDLYKGHYEGLYCVGCEAFYLEKDLVEGKCPVHGTEPKKVREENYFFRLSRYTEPLLSYMEAHPEFIEPDMRRNEVMNVVRSGLDDVSVSRASIQWGIPLPMDPAQTVYVWFDALLNYATFVGLRQDSPEAKAMWAKWWPADCHVVGKDITRFHCIIWPAMLMSADIELPKSIYAHGFLQSVGGEKFSKTTGNVVDPLDVGQELKAATGGALADDLIHEPLRYYLLREVTMGRDGEFSWDLFVERYNSDLANELGNLLNRALSMTHRYFGGKLEAAAGPPEGPDLELAELATDVIGRYTKAMGTWQFSLAAQETWRLVKRANQYVQEMEPWNLAKDPARKGRLCRVLATLLESLRVTSALVAPAMPRAAARMGRDLGLNWPTPTALQDLAWQGGDWALGHGVGEAVVLFPRVQAPKPAKA